MPSNAAIMSCTTAAEHDVMFAGAYPSLDSDNEMLCCRLFKGVL